jgi:hypothetical protein
MKNQGVSFDFNKADGKLIRRIAHRASVLFTEHGVPRDEVDIQMDVAATHCNGCPLRLKELLNADEFNFAHDMAGIRDHLDRKTGKLKKFLPRFSL